MDPIQRLIDWQQRSLWPREREFVDSGCYRTTTRSNGDVTQELVVTENRVEDKFIEALDEKYSPLSLTDKMIIERVLAGYTQEEIGKVFDHKQPWVSKRLDKLQKILE